MFKWVLFDDFESMLLQKLFCFKFILLQEIMRSGLKVFKFFLQNIEFILGIYYTTHSILSPNNSPLTCFQVCLCYAKNFPFLKASLRGSDVIVCGHNF